MNTKQQLSFAWTVASVFAVLLLIAVYFLAVPSAASRNITETRDSIREHCQATDQASKDKCAQDLQDMTDTLRELTQAKAQAQSAAKTDAAGVPSGQGTFKVGQ